MPLHPLLTLPDLAPEMDSFFDRAKLGVATKADKARLFQQAADKLCKAYALALPDLVLALVSPGCIQAQDIQVEAGGDDLSTFEPVLTTAVTAKVQGPELEET